MKNKDKLIEEIKQGFQANKGKGSIYCFTKEIIPDIVFNMIIFVSSLMYSITIMRGSIDL